jgi:hypothetical protein
MLNTLVHTARSGAQPIFVRHCHTANLIKHELAILRRNLSGLISERKLRQEACQSPFKPLSGVYLYYKSIIEVYNQKIPTLQIRIEGLEKQIQKIQTAPKKTPARGSYLPN